ncbi:MAG TPA: glycosyltransferase family 2 protein, partial [Niabella sp.]|nr:glycosyltransferase family 2 protein [Niabella sp.]
MRPAFIPAYITKHNKSNEALLLDVDAIQKRIKALDKNAVPLVSVVIPAYNEEKGILKTLSSLSDMKTDYPTEIIVVDNNSSDNTKAIVTRAGARYIFEGRPGVENARNAGLEHAKGTYVISGDAD